MPDSRNLVVSTTPDPRSAPHLWTSSINSNQLTPLTTGTDWERKPAVSPDGKSILYSMFTSRYDVTLVSVDDGSTKTLLTTGHWEQDAVWSANQSRLVWVTNRNGPLEIWIRMPDGSEWPVITAADFPGGAQSLANPAISPDGERIICTGPNPDN